MFFIIGAGSLLRFVYEWTGRSSFFGLFVPVNESIWEHLKLGYWALVTFLAPEYLKVKIIASNLFFAKLAGIIGLESTILIVSFSYTAFTGRNILFIDILSYAAGAVFCQLVVIMLSRKMKRMKIVYVLGFVGLAAVAFIFMLLTFSPPKNELFRDKQTGSYGIEQNMP